MGGSLGASAFNKLLPPILHKLSLQNQIEVIHQSGEKHYEELVRTYLNLATVMFLGGLWHGASWNFVMWGMLHGAYLAIHKLIMDKFPHLKKK